MEIMEWWQSCLGGSLGAFLIDAVRWWERFPNKLPRTKTGYAKHMIATLIFIVIGAGVGFAFHGWVKWFLLMVCLGAAGPAIVRLLARNGEEIGKTILNRVVSLIKPGVAKKAGASPHGNILVRQGPADEEPEDKGIHEKGDLNTGAFPVVDETSLRGSGADPVAEKPDDANTGSYPDKPGFGANSVVEKPEDPITRTRPAVKKPENHSLGANPVEEKPEDLITGAFPVVVEPEEHPIESPQQKPSPRPQTDPHSSWLSAFQW